MSLSLTKAHENTTYAVFPVLKAPAVGGGGNPEWIPD